MQEVIKKIQTACRLFPQEEICGIIDSENNIIPIQNVAKYKQHCFVFDKREYFSKLKELQAAGLTIKYIYHTHPAGDCSPSESDCKFILLSKKDALIISPNTYKVITYAEN